MRIAQVTPVYPPVRGGIGAVAAEYTRGLCELGEDVTVYTPDYRGKGQQDGDVVRVKPWYAWGFAAFVPQLLWKLRRFDVIHLHHSFYGGEEVTALAAWLWRIPLVVTYHMQPKAAGWVGVIMKLHRLLVEPFVMRVAKVILVSSQEYSVDNGLANENTFSTESKFSVMPLGVDTKTFTPGISSEFRARHGISPDAKVIIFVGGLASTHYFKGVPVLLAAAARMNTDPSWHLLIVGHGNKREEFIALAATLGLATRVTFAGEVAPDELPDAYRAADLHVLPSIDRSEAFGLVTLEAMATGIPSVVSDLPGMRTLVVTGETGLLVAPGDAASLAQVLAELLQLDSRRRTMGAAARVRAVEQYDAKNLIDRLRTIYRKL